MDTDLRLLVSLLSLLIIALHVPFLPGRVPPNRFYGFRTRLTMRPDVWYPANAFAARAMIAALGAAIVIVWAIPRSRVPDAFPVVVLVAAIAVALLASFLHLRRYRQT